VFVRDLDVLMRYWTCLA